MAYASDRLRERRSRKPGTDGDEPSTDSQSMSKPTDRSLQLTDDEVKALAGSYEPGAEAECLVKGRIDKSGKLDVISVQPVGGSMPSEEGAEPAAPANQMMMPG